MSRLAIILAAGLLLVGCSDDNSPSAYKHARDQFFAVLPIAILIDDDFVPCFRTISGEPSRLAAEDCYVLTSPQRMRGIAVTGFETGEFYPGRTTLPQNDEWSDIWVELDPRTLQGDVRNKCKEGCTIYLDFVGRRTAVPGQYGHLGASEHQVFVDKVLSAKLLK